MNPKKRMSAEQSELQVMAAVRDPKVQQTEALCFYLLTRGYDTVASQAAILKVHSATVRKRFRALVQAGYIEQDITTYPHSYSSTKQTIKVELR